MSREDDGDATEVVLFGLAALSSGSTSDVHGGISVALAGDECGYR